MTSKSDVHEKIERKLSFPQWLIIVVIGFVVFIFISLIDVAGREFTGKVTPNVMRIFVWVYIFTIPLYQIFKSSNEESKKFLHYILSVIIGLLIFEGIALAFSVIILNLFNTFTLTGILIFSIIFGIGRFVLVIWFLNWLPKKTLYVGAVTAMDSGMLPVNGNKPTVDPDLEGEGSEADMRKKPPLTENGAVQRATAKETATKPVEGKANIVTENSVLKSEKWRILREYDEVVAKAFEDFESLGEEYQIRFAEKVVNVEPGDRNVELIVKSIYEAYKAEYRISDREEINQAYKQMFEINDNAAEEFRNVIETLGDQVDIESIVKKNRIEILRL